jgi:hypothetical protein
MLISYVKINQLCVCMQVVQYRGEGLLRPVAAFLAASLLDGKDGKACKAADGSWVGLRFGRAQAGDVRDKLRLMAAGAWQQILKSPL